MLYNYLNTIDNKWGLTENFSDPLNWEMHAQAFKDFFLKFLLNF
jgi:hypothetical protein